MSHQIPTETAVDAVVEWLLTKADGMEALQEAERRVTRYRESETVREWDEQRQAENVGRFRALTLKEIPFKSFSDALLEAVDWQAVAKRVVPGPAESSCTVIA